MGRRIAIYVGLALALILLCGLSLMVGRVWAPWSAWVDRTDPRWAILFDLRLPRTVLGLMVGAGLGLAGAALQGYTRNPLADPGALGVSSMAALGAVLTLYLGSGAQAPWMISTAAMLMALLAVTLLLLFAGLGSGVVTFVLSGVILQTLAAAGVALALSLAPNPWAVNEIINWLMGSLADRSMDEVRFAAPFMAVGAVVILVTGRGLDALTLGETTARSLGVDLRLTQLLLALGVALVTGASVAVTGVISFVGLIVPHLVRPLVGGRPGALLLPSALAGAVLVLAADILVRLTPAAQEVKLGVAMAALGAPFFFGLLVTLRRKLV
jgi:iron complex transport system permease protein